MGQAPRGVVHFVYGDIWMDKQYFKADSLYRNSVAQNKKRDEIVYHFVHLPTEQFFLSRLADKVEQTMHIVFCFKW